MSLAPERVSRAALVSPAAVAAGPIPRVLFDVALPMLHYRLRPTRKRLVRAAGGPPSTWTSRCGALRSAKLYFHERWRQRHIWAVVGRKVRSLTCRGLRAPQRLHSLRHPSCSLRHTWLRRPREDAGGARDDLG